MSYLHCFLNNVSDRCKVCGWSLESGLPLSVQQNAIMQGTLLWLFEFMFFSFCLIVVTLQISWLCRHFNIIIDNLQQLEMFLDQNSMRLWTDIDEHCKEHADPEDYKFTNRIFHAFTK